MIRYKFTAGGYAFFRDDSGCWNVSRSSAETPTHCAYATPEAIATLKGISGEIIPQARAAEIVTAQNAFPYWGNFRRFMSLEEIGITESAFATAPGRASFGDIVRAFAGLPKTEREES